MDKINMKDICEERIVQTGDHGKAIVHEYLKPNLHVLLNVINNIIDEVSKIDKMQDEIEMLKNRNEMLMNILSGSNISDIGDKIEEIEKEGNNLNSNYKENKK